MPDMTDDWMNPRTSTSWQAGSEETSRPFLIQREATIPCTFVGKPPTEWRTYSSHRTREERDTELTRLREGHPAWHLRPAREISHFGNREVRVEDDEADLMRRLARVRADKGTA